MEQRRDSWTRFADADELIALGRTRELSPLESRQLEEAMRHGERKGQRAWTRFDDRKLLQLLERGKKPRNIAPILGRTERAVWRRIYRNGWGVRAMPKSSIARASRK